MPGYTETPCVYHVSFYRTPVFTSFEYPIQPYHPPPVASFHRRIALPTLVGHMDKISIYFLESNMLAFAKSSYTVRWFIFTMDSLVDAANERGDDGSEASMGLSGQNGGSGGITDEEIQALLEEQTTNIVVVGCGGAGCNTATRMVQEGIDGAHIVAANTDVQHLSLTDADTRLLIGKKVTEGKGAGSLPQVGEEAAVESEHDIEDQVQGADMVFVTAGLGGGTGTGSAPVVAQLAKDAGALTIAVVTLPFTAEGKVRLQNADYGLEKLRDAADTVIVVPNDKLTEVVGSMPVEQAFKVADEVLLRSVKGITQLITGSGLVNLDFADVRTVMENGDVALIGLGESDTEKRAEDSVKRALRSPLLDVDISGAKSVLVNVTGGSDMSIEEAEGVVEHLHELVDEDARIIWGTAIDPEMEGTMQTMLVVTGVRSPQIYGKAPEKPAPTDIDYMV